MVVRDKLTRDRYMAPLLQAFNCTEYRSLRDVTAPNIAAHNPLGSIELVDLGWWEPLGSNRVQLNVAARLRGTPRDPRHQTGAKRTRADRCRRPSRSRRWRTRASASSSSASTSRVDAPAGLIDAVEGTSSQFSSITVYAHYRDPGRALLTKA